MHIERTDPYWKWDWEEFRKVEDFDEREAMLKLPEKFFEKAKPEQTNFPYQVA